MHAPTQTPILFLYARQSDVVVNAIVDMLGMEMQTNTLMCVFVGRGRGGGWD